MADRVIVVCATYDPEAKVWWTEESDLHGLHAEGATLEELRDKLPGMIGDLIEANEPQWLGCDIGIEIMARGRLHLTVPAVAAA